MEVNVCVSEKEGDTEVASNDTASSIIIKKRHTRPNQRRRDDSDDEKPDNGDQQNSEIDRNKLKDIKLLQQVRQRQSGVSVQELILGDKKSDRAGNGTDDLKTIFGNQFNSTMDYGFQQDVPHQKLMEDFIDQRLGLKKDENKYAHIAILTFTQKSFIHLSTVSFLIVRLLERHVLMTNCISCLRISK